MSVKRKRRFIIISVTTLTVILLSGVIMKDLCLLLLNIGGDDTKIYQAEFGLFLRAYHKKKDLYTNIFVRSLSYFWPNDTVPITVVLDDEKPEDHEFGQEISQQYPYPDVRFEVAVEPRLYGYHGHHRQQWSMLYADRYTNYKYVGFVDTDTLFVTTATKELMFENGKPIVIGQYGKAASDFWSEIGMGTLTMFKTLEVMRCMSYFPVIIKLDHLIELRKHVEKLHNKPFDEVFAKISPRGRFAQFNLMCQFIWHFHQDEYVFRMQLRTKNGIWRGEDNSPYRLPYEFYKRFPSELTNPIPRTSIHYRYHRNFNNETIYRDLLKRGLCFSGGFQLCKDMCKHFNENSLHRELFLFEYSDWSWDARCRVTQEVHYTNVKTKLTSDARNRIQKGCDEIDHAPFKL